MGNKLPLRTSIPATVNNLTTSALIIFGAGSIAPSVFVEPQYFHDQLQAGVTVAAYGLSIGFGLLGTFNAASIVMNYISDREERINAEKLPLQAQAKREKKFQSIPRKTGLQPGGY